MGKKKYLTIDEFRDTKIYREAGYCVFFDLNEKEVDEDKIPDETEVLSHSKCYRGRVKVTLNIYQ